MRAIDADALIDKYGDWYTEEGTEEGYIGTIKGIVDSMPTIEPGGKKGKWNKYYRMHYRDIFCCNKCGGCFIVLQGSESMNFCPNCGSYNGGDQDENN